MRKVANKKEREREMEQFDPLVGPNGLGSTS